MLHYHHLLQWGQIFVASMKYVKNPTRIIEAIGKPAASRQCLQQAYTSGLAWGHCRVQRALYHLALPAPEALTSFRTFCSSLQPWSLTHLCTHSSSFSYVCCAQAHSELRQALCVSKELETTGQENRLGARPVWEQMLWRCHKLTDAFGGLVSSFRA